MNLPWKQPSQHAITYRSRITLSEQHWARLRWDAERRGISGAVYLSFILAEWANKLPAIEEPPLPEPEGNDGPDPDEPAGPMVRLRRVPRGSPLSEATR